MVYPGIFLPIVWKGDNNGITQMQLHVCSAEGSGKSGEDWRQ
jgi:hypothetical protein